MKKISKNENVKTFPLPETNGISSGGSFTDGAAIRHHRAPLRGLGALNDGLYTGIDTDPFGSWTGVPTDDPDSRPIQDADDL